MRELTFKERLFVEAYIGTASGNGAESARIAGYAWPEKVATRLLARSSVRTAIHARVASAAISANEVLARVSDIATADITEFLEIQADGTWRVNLAMVRRRRKGHLIHKIKVTEFGTQVELEGKLAALIKLGEYFGLWDREKPPEVSLVELAKRLKERYDRAAGLGDTNGPAGDVQGLTAPLQ
jgi:phage terminase small subunit